MSKCLLDTIWEKYMSCRKDSKEVQDIDRHDYTRFMSKSMDRSYYSDSREQYAKDFMEVFSGTLNDQSKLEKMISEKPEFVKEYMRNCLAGMKFSDSYKYPMSFRKLLVSLVDKEYFMLMFDKPSDFDDLYEEMYDRVNSSNNKAEVSAADKKAEVLRLLFDSYKISDRFKTEHLVRMSFQDLMEIFVNQFNVNKKVLMNQNGYHYHKEFAKAVYNHLERVIDPEKSEALKEWDQLSDEDKDLISTMILKYKMFSVGEFVGYEEERDFDYFKKFKSLDILEAYTFKLSSSTGWWKGKSILTNVFAVWYACKKGQVPKYVSNKFGKFKPLLNLYKYNWEEIRKLIMKDKEVIEALN